VDWEPVKRLSIDEVSKCKGHQDFATVVTDIDRGKLIEVIDSHKQDDIIEVLKQQPLQLREQVEEVSVDIAILNHFQKSDKIILVIR
jgi:transposase